MVSPCAWRGEGPNSALSKRLPDGEDVDAGRVAPINGKGARAGRFFWARCGRGGPGSRATVCWESLGSTRGAICGGFEVFSRASAVRSSDCRMGRRGTVRCEGWPWGDRLAGGGPLPLTPAGWGTVNHSRRPASSSGTGRGCRARLLPRTFLSPGDKRDTKLPALYTICRPRQIGSSLRESPRPRPHGVAQRAAGHGGFAFSTVVVVVAAAAETLITTCTARRPRRPPPRLPPPVSKGG